MMIRWEAMNNWFKLTEVTPEGRIGMGFINSELCMSNVWTVNVLKTEQNDKGAVRIVLDRTWVCSYRQWHIDTYIKGCQQIHKMCWQINWSYDLCAEARPVYEEVNHSCKLSGAFCGTGKALYNCQWQNHWNLNLDLPSLVYILFWYKFLSFATFKVINLCLEWKIENVTCQRISIPRIAYLSSIILCLLSDHRAEKRANTHTFMYQLKASRWFVDLDIPAFQSLRTCSCSLQAQNSVQILFIQAIFCFLSLR